jgi:hypothetical protein
MEVPNLFFNYTHYNAFSKLKNNEKEVIKEFSVLFNNVAECSPIHHNAEIVQMILEGKGIAEALLKGQDVPERTPQDALKLVWFIMACAYQEGGDTFNRGTVRLHPLSEKQSGMFKEFFSKSPGVHAHSRPSTHFKEMTVGKQKGLDFGKKTLPFDEELATMLCGRLRDNSFFIKLEREAVSLTSPVATVRHMHHWKEHADSGGGEKVVGGKDTRRETDGQETIREAFKEVLSQWGVIGQSYSEKKMKDKKIQRKVKEEVKTCKRIFEMSSRVEEIKTLVKLNDMPNAAALKDLRKAIDEFERIKEDIPNADVASGSEVIIDLAKYV